MSQLTVSCPHCAKPTRLDADKLPNQPAFFPCPHCQGRVVVDKSKELPAEQAAAPPPASAPPTAESAPPAMESTIADRRFAAPPSDAILPSGIIVGQDRPEIDEIRAALAALGSEVEPIASLETARQRIIDESPELCIFVAETVNAAPHEPLAALTRLRPNIRRRMYLVLIADGVNSGDGAAAFMHEVNLVLARKDLSQLGAAIHCGLEHHLRLYRPYLEATESKGTD